MSGRNVRLDIPDQIVVNFIQRAAMPPAHLADLVRQYRDLQYFVEDSDECMERSNALYDRLLAAVTDRNTVDPAKQVRRLERREYARLSFQQRCDLAIAKWRAGVRV